MNVVEKELLAAAEFKPRKKYTNRQEYLRAVVNAISKLDDDDFEALSDDAAEWCNSAIEVLNTTKNGDIPDFDEVQASEDDTPEDEPETEDDEQAEDEPEDEDADDEEEGDPEDDEGEADDEPSEDDEPEDEPEEELAPKKGKSKAEQIAPRKGKSVRSKEGKAAIAATKPKTPANMDVELDKWGCMKGSKNSQALAMFEAGATTAEVKAKVGGTYYNILKKAVERGHRLEKEGAMLKLTHADDIGKAKPKAPAKPAAKKGKK